MGGAKAVIFSSGPVSDYGFIAERLSAEDYIICADGGVRHCIKCGFKPNVVIGDMDSCRCDIDKNVLIKYPCDKDDTDTSLCIKHAVEKGFDNIEIFGALGGSLSHTIANIQMLAYCKKIGVSCILSDACESAFMLSDEKAEFKISGYTLVSVFSYTNEARGVTLKGFKYPLENAVLKSSFPLGVSNEPIQEKVSLSVKDGTLLIILSQR